MANTVLTGPLAGYTKPQLLALRVELQQALMSGGTLVGASVNGQSFSKTPGLGAAERLRIVNAALAQVDPTAFAEGSTIYTRFSSPC